MDTNQWEFMYKKHSFEEKLRCMKLLDEGYPLRRLSRESGILRNQLRDLRKRYVLTPITSPISLRLIGV